MVDFFCGDDDAQYEIFVSSPFNRTLPNIPVDGKDLNPLLQDPGLIFHPPMLYMGYVVPWCHLPLHGGIVGGAA